MDDKKLMELYPSAYRRVRAWMEERGDTPAAPSELVSALGFITREEVIRRILDGADWAREEGGGYVYAVPDGKNPAAVKSGTASSSAGGETPGNRLSETVRRILKKETERNRIGVSVTYLKRLSGNPPDAELTALLNNAPWAVRQYGFYRYAGEEETPEEEICEQLSMVAPPEENPIREEELSSEHAPTDPAVPTESGTAAKEGTESGSWQQLSMSIPDDEREELRVGTVLRVKRRARFLLATVDFGSGLGKAIVRIPSVSVAETTEKSPGPWAGRQIVCGIRMIGGEREVRLKGIGLENGMVALSPTEQVRNGDRVE